MKPMYSFEAELQIIGVNPFVYVPKEILSALLAHAGKEKGPVPVHGILNGKPYTQTLVRFAGEWRLYINTSMLHQSPKRIGERCTLTIGFDARERKIAVPKAFDEALQQDAGAKLVFEKLPPSRKLEIVRYLAGLKSEAALERNIQRALVFLKGEGRFVGRDKPL